MTRDVVTLKADAALSDVVVGIITESDLLRLARRLLKERSKS